MCAYQPGRLSQIDQLKHSIISSILHSQKKSPIKQNKDIHSTTMGVYSSMQNLFQHDIKTQGQFGRGQMCTIQSQATSRGSVDKRCAANGYQLLGEPNKHNHSRTGPNYGFEKENQQKVMRQSNKSQTVKIKQLTFDMKIISERFQKIKFLGKGKYSDVFLALDRRNKTIIALKIIQKKVIQRFNLERLLIQEIKVHSYFQHSNILKYYGCMSDNQQVLLRLNLQFAIIVEYCDTNLQKCIDKIKKLPMDQKNHLVYQMISAISYMHHKNVIHRDLKPENILILQNQIKICDFGIAQHVKGNGQLKQICGTPGYMAPEVIAGQLYDHKADAYSLGMIIDQLYEEGDDFKIIAKDLMRENQEQRSSVESLLKLPQLCVYNSQKYSFPHFKI